MQMCEVIDSELAWIMRDTGCNMVVMRVGHEKWWITNPSQLLPLISGENAPIPANLHVHAKTFYFTNNTLSVEFDRFIGNRKYLYKTIVNKDRLTQFIIEGILMYEPMIKL